MELQNERIMDYLVQALVPTIAQQQTVMRQPIPPTKRVAMTVWSLANVASYWEVSNQFGVGLSSVAVTIVEVCQAMEMLLLRKKIKRLHTGGWCMINALIKGV